MIFVDTESNTVIAKGKLDWGMNEVLNAIMEIAKDGGKRVKDGLRKVLISDKFWDKIECDEDEEDEEE